MVSLEISRVEGSYGFPADFKGLNGLDENQCPVPSQWSWGAGIHCHMLRLFRLRNVSPCKWAIEVYVL